MDFEIDGVTFSPWQRPEYSEGMKPSSPLPGKAHEVEEVFEACGFATKDIKLNTGKIPSWQRFFLDTELFKMSPLVVKVHDAVQRALAVSQDYTPEARIKRQEEALASAFKQLGEAAAEAIKVHVEDWQRVEDLAVQLPEPPKEGNAAILYTLQAVELRNVLRAMKPEEREAYVRGQMMRGSLLPLQACVSAPDSILSPGVLDSIRRDRIRAQYPKIDVWRNDLRAIAAEAYRTFGAVFGHAAFSARRAVPAVTLKDGPEGTPFGFSSTPKRLEVKITRPAALEDLKKYEIVLRRRDGRALPDQQGDARERVAALRRAGKLPGKGA